MTGVLVTFAAWLLVVVFIVAVALAGAGMFRGPRR